MHVRQRRQLAHALAPRLELRRVGLGAAAQPRLAQVVEHHGHLGVARQQRRRRVELRGRALQVEGQAVRRERRKPRLELRREERVTQEVDALAVAVPNPDEGVRRVILAKRSVVVHHVPYADEVRQLRLEVNIGDHANLCGGGRARPQQHLQTGK